MDIVELGRLPWSDIVLFDTTGGRAAQIAHGLGDTNVRLVRFTPGGSIGMHETGSGQLFLPLEGTGWVQEGDGPRVAISVGFAAFFPRGVLHAKGSDAGMVALMVQTDDLALGGEL